MQNIIVFNFFLNSPQIFPFVPNDVDALALFILFIVILSYISVARN